MSEEEIIQTKTRYEVIQIDGNKVEYDELYKARAYRKRLIKEYADRIILREVIEYAK